MDTPDIYQLVEEFGYLRFLSAPYRQQLLEVFTNLEDGGDSALKILIPLLLAYSRLDNEYGRDAEKIVTVSISENNRIKIILNCPISINEIYPFPNGLVTSVGPPIEFQR